MRKPNARAMSDLEQFFQIFYTEASIAHNAF